MKKIKFLLLTVLAVTIFSCGSDDAPAPEVSEDNLVGTYDITFYEGSSEESTSTSTGNQSVIETITFSGDTFTDAIFTFSSAGTYVSSGDYRESLTVTNSSGTSTSSSIEDFNDSGSFSVNTASRTITLDGEIYDVTLFDGTNLYIESEETFQSGNNNITEIERYRLVKRN